MINSIRRRGRGNKIVSLAVVAFMTIGVGLVATPAFAEDPPASFHPDDDDNDTGLGDRLSDRFDGTDQTAHLTAVAPIATDRVEWYVCSALASGAGATQAELAGSCTLIGTDTSPNTPAGLPASIVLPSPADEAYEFFWDIPSTFDTLTRDILVLACIGAGTDVEGAGQNCSQSNEEDIRLDDAGAAPGSATTTGEITQLCTSQNPQGAAGGACRVTGAPAGDRADIDARFKDLKHGDALPETGFTIRATTSPDVTALTSHLDLGADAGNDPQISDVDSTCTIIDSTASFLRWECSFLGGGGAGSVEAAITAAGGNRETALWITETAGGTNDCAGSVAPAVAPGFDCTLDNHYHGLAPRALASVVQSFETGGGGHTHLPPSPPSNAGCQSGETPVKSHSVESLGADEVIEICTTDQFGQPINVAVTEEVTSPGTFVGGEDHDGDGRAEMAHGTTVGGVLAFTVENFNNTVGTATITSCFEGQTGTTAAGHGCGNETLKDTLTLAFATTPTQVFLAFAGTATNANDPCRTGATIANGVVGQRETLVVCTFDSQGNAVSTAVDASRLQWVIVGAHGNDAPSVRFVGTPPSETGANGTATVQIDDIGPGDNFIEVILLDRNGNRDESFFVEKDVAGSKKSCAKQRLRVKRAKQKLRAAKATGDNDKIRRAKKRLRRARRALRRCLRSG